MKKEAIKESKMEPKPNAIVSSRYNGEDNALVVAFASNASLDPPMLMVGIVPSRYSYEMIKESGEYVVNIPAKDFKEQFQYLGTVSRRDENKLKDMNTIDADIVDVPILCDCPVNFECKVIDSFQPENGTHEFFVGKIEKVHCDEKYLDDNNEIMWDKIDLL
jgi:flavin reductase (DIM6/NTAB) family NADH-FMN oxidoreductase RutF